MVSTNGKGDLFLADSVARALGATGFAPLRRVAVAARQDAITLRGRVPSFFLKQLAQAAARGVAGVVAVRNHLDVAHPPARDHVSPAAAPG
jgi:osmotically-inducible protein OsmY